MSREILPLIQPPGHASHMFIKHSATQQTGAVSSQKLGRGVFIDGCLARQQQKATSCAQHCQEGGREGQTTSSETCTRRWRRIQAVTPCVVPQSLAHGCATRAFTPIAASCRTRSSGPTSSASPVSCSNPLPDADSLEVTTPTREAQLPEQAEELQLSLETKLLYYFQIQRRQAYQRRTMLEVLLIRTHRVTCLASVAASELFHGCHAQSVRTIGQGPGSAKRTPRSSATLICTCVVIQTPG